MDPIALVFLVINALALLLLPRRWAALPLVVGACYMTRGQAVELGAVSLTVVRILVAVGIVRVLLRGERIVGGVNRLDALMLAFGVWMVVVVVFHDNPESPFTLRMRDLYEAWGLYFLFRVFCSSKDDLSQVARIVALALFPVAVAMVFEKLTGTNLFARFGGVPAFSTVRNGVIRAQGPFAHAILAGSIGGVCLPLVAGLYRKSRRVCGVGVVSCLGIVLASGSSGPLLSSVAGLGLLLLWPIRERMRSLRWAALSGYLLLDLVMNRPAYFIIADLDLMGGSTSWHRAELIRASFAHFHEWWLVGTDYTRHWMDSGVPSTPTQIDITNHFIAMGVVGGVLLMALFIALVWQGFWYVGTAIRDGSPPEEQFASWTVGASLFAHAATCLSVSYYDHSILFFYLTLAATAATIVNSPRAVGQATPARVEDVRALGRLRPASSLVSQAAPVPSVSMHRIVRPRQQRTVPR